MIQSLEYLVEKLDDDGFADSLDRLEADRSYFRSASLEDIVRDRIRPKLLSSMQGE